MVQSTETTVFLAHVEADPLGFRETLLSMARFYRTRRWRDRTPLGDFILANVAYGAGYCAIADPDYLQPLPPGSEPHKQWGRVRAGVLQAMVAEVGDLSQIDPAAIEQWVYKSL